MPYVLKPNKLFARDPEHSDQYLPQNVVTDRLTGDLVAEINAAGIARKNEVNSAGAAQVTAVTEAGAATISNVQQAVADSQAAVAGIDTQRDQMIAAIAAVAGQGTDDTFSQSGVAADAAAVGGLKNTLNRDFKEIVGIYDLLSLATWENGVIGDTGAESSSTTSKRSSLIPVSNGKYSVIYSKPSTAGQFRIHGYKNGSWVRMIYKENASRSNYMYTFDVDNTIDAVRFSIYTDVTMQLLFKGTTDTIVKRVEMLEGSINNVVVPDVGYYIGNISNYGGVLNYKNTVVSTLTPCKIGDYVTADTGYKIKVVIFSKKEVSETYFVKYYAWTDEKIEIDTDGYVAVLISDSTHYNDTTYVLTDTAYSEHLHFHFTKTLVEIVDETNDEIDRNRVLGNETELYKALKAVASDWHFPFIDVYNQLGLGENHIIPGTAKTWSSSGTVDLNQKDTWMQDGTHPYKGVGLVDMYGRTIANQFELITPSYNNGAGQTSPTYWAGKRLLWMGTSIPAGSDPYAGEGTGATYPSLVATQLGATVINIAKGSSCVRINASDGEYTNMHFNHFIRTITRTIDECDAIAADWSNIYSKISGAPSTLSADDIATMKAHSFETFILPYLDGTNTMPDCFVIDYGHNDKRPRGIDGEMDLWIVPNEKNIGSGLLAEDEYMTANNYAKLKLALNQDLSGITNLSAFAATLNRNCLQGAMNFLITVILRYNPYARIVIVSDYN